MVKKKDIEDAFLAELDQWPLVGHRFDKREKHPCIVLDFCGLERFVMYAGTPSSESSLDNSLADLRRELKAMGAVRNRPPKAEPKPHSPPNDGKAKRPDPCAGPRVKPKPALREQLKDATGRDIFWDGQPIDREGEFEIDEDAYHADPVKVPSCSGSLIKRMWERTPWHGWTAHPRLNPNFERKETDTFDLGKAFHKEILGKGADFAIFAHKDWRTGAAQADKAEARAQGLIPILEAQYERVLAMGRAARWQMHGWEELHFAMAGGAPERALVWLEQTPHGEVWCRALLDWIPHGGAYFPDWKSTGVGAGPDDWGARTMWDTHCDIQEAFTRRGVRKVLGREMDMIFPVVETDEPHAMMVHRVHKAYQDDADAKVQWGLNVFAMCMARKHWPGYPRQIAWQEPPPWKRALFENRREAGVMEPNFWVQMIENAKAATDRPEKRTGSETADAFGLEPASAQPDDLDEMLQRAATEEGQADV